MGNFGIAPMDDLSTQRVLLAVAPTLQRNLICMELNANLQAAERKNALKRFPGSAFKRVAVVVIGEPTAKHKERIHKMMLDEKIEVAEKEKQKKAEEKERNKWWEEKEAKKRKVEEDKDGKKDDDAKDGEGAEKKDGEEAKPDETKEAEETVEEKPVELSDEEKAMSYRKLPSPDVAPATLAKCYANYSIPSTDEGFDEIRYVWSKADVCADKFKEWILDKKRTMRIEDLEPSSWFKEKWTAWEKVLGEWEQALK